MSSMTDDKKQAVLEEHMHEFKDIFDINFSLISINQDSAHLIEQHFARKISESNIIGTKACQAFIEENDRLQYALNIAAEEGTRDIEAIANRIYQDELGENLCNVDFDAICANFEAIDDGEEIEL